VSYLWLPGASGEYVSIPDPGTVTDFFVGVWLSRADWTQAGGSTIASQWGSIGQRSWSFRIDGSGFPVLFVSADGTATTLSVTASAGYGFTDGTGHWVGVGYDADSGGGNYSLKFYDGGTSPAGPVWAMLGLERTGASVAVNDGTSNVEVGSVAAGTSEVWIGGLRRFLFYGSFDRSTSPLIDANFAALTEAEVTAAAFTDDAATPNTVTLNGSGWLNVRTLGGGLLGQAEAVYLPDRYDGPGGMADRSGNDHHMLFPGGTNDPTFFDLANGKKWLRLPGVVGSVLTATSLDLGGDTTFDFRFTVKPDAFSGLQMCYENANGVLNFGFSGDKLYLRVYDSVTAAWTSSVAVPYSAGSWFQIRGTVDTSMVGNTTADFYTRAIGTALDVDTGWDLLEADVPVDGGARDVGGVVAFSTAMKIGGHGNVLAGGIAAGYATTDAGVVWINFSIPDDVVSEPFTTFTGREDTPLTWTVGVAASGEVARVVDRAHFWFDTDDYLSAADHADLNFAAAESFTAMVAYRPARITNSPILIAKKTGTAAAVVGWLLQHHSDTNVYVRFADGAAAEISGQAGPSLHTAGVAVGVRNVTDDDSQAFVDGAGGTAGPDDTTGTLSNGEELRLGRFSGVGTAYLDGEIHAAAVWRSALTDAEVADLQGILFGRSRRTLLGVGS